jgi:hypothetical protein
MAKSRVRFLVVQAFVAVSLLIGVAATLSLGRALSDALGAAYSQGQMSALLY